MNSSYKELFNLIDINNIKENFREVFYIYQSLLKLREQFPDKDLTVDELSACFWAIYPDSNKEIYSGLFKTLSEASIDPEVGLGIAKQIKTRQRALKASEVAYGISQGTHSLPELRSLLEQMEDVTGQITNEDTFVTTDLEAIVDGVVRTPGIRWRLDCLNKSLGSLRKGDFGFIFARPETGKTTFVADVAAGAFDQVTQPVVWFCNEEAGNKVMLRVYQSYFGVTLDVLLANTRKYKEAFQDRVGGKFLLVDSAQIDRTTVERIHEKYKPSLVIYDQIGKIKGFKADREDLVQGAIYQWARELAKEYCPSIGVCQADGTGEGVKWLTMANVADAKTTKQAEADWILGIGKIHSEEAEYVRYLNISKNKLVGDADSIQSLRHGRFEVLIEPEVGKYKDIVIYQ